MENIQELIETALTSTGRAGIDDLIEHLRAIGFYDAPASTKYHGAYKGALAEHSYNVLQCALKLANAWLDKETVNKMYNSIVISALLHDLGKAGQYGKPLYVDNILKTGQSKAQPFKTNDELMSLDHEIVSVIEASKYIELTEEEQHAIIFHNGLYTNIGRYSLQGKETPLQMIIHFADLWASRVVERVSNE